MKQQMDQQQKPTGLGQHYSNQLASGKIANLMSNNQTAMNNQRGQIRNQNIMSNPISGSNTSNNTMQPVSHQQIYRNDPKTYSLKQSISKDGQQMQSSFQKGIAGGIIISNANQIENKTGDYRTNDQNLYNERRGHLTQQKAPNSFNYHHQHQTSLKNLPNLPQNESPGKLQKVNAANNDPMLQQKLGRQNIS